MIHNRFRHTQQEQLKIVKTEDSGSELRANFHPAGTASPGCNSLIWTKVVELHVRSYLAGVELMHERLCKLGLASARSTPQKYILAAAQAFESFLKKPCWWMVVSKRVSGGERWPLRCSTPW